MIPYVVFGVLTTLINILVYWLLAHFLYMGTMPSTMIAWIIAVLFAFFTNRKWVFHSQTHTMSAIVKEMISFFTCRLATGAVDWFCMFVFVDIFHFNDMVIKFLVNVVVVILNYLASKLVVFKHRE